MTRPLRSRWRLCREGPHARAADANAARDEPGLADGTNDVPLPLPVASPGPTLSAEPWAEAYKAVRAHELMLNEATSALERARLIPIVTLNGGAIVAFLTLLGALAGKDARFKADLVLAGVAVAAWAVGLVLAALAGWLATRHQAAINRGHRLMRERLEAALLDRRIAQILRPPKEPPADTIAVDRDEKSLEDADRSRQRDRITAGAAADRYGNRFTAMWSVSALLFLVGAGLALFAVVIVPVGAGKVRARLALTDPAVDRLRGVCTVGPAKTIVVNADLDDLGQATVLVAARDSATIRLRTIEIAAARPLERNDPEQLTKCSELVP